MAFALTKPKWAFNQINYTIRKRKEFIQFFIVWKNNVAISENFGYK